MKGIRIAIPDILEAAPYFALDDLSDTEIHLTTLLKSSKLLNDNKVELALIPITYFFDHGGLSALPYGIIFYSAQSPYAIESSCLPKNSNSLRTPFLAAILAGKTQTLTEEIIIKLIPSLELGLESKLTRARNWAQIHGLSAQTAELYIKGCIDYRIDHETITALEAKVMSDIHVGIIPQNSLSTLYREIRSIKYFDLNLSFQKYPTSRQLELRDDFSNNNRLSISEANDIYFGNYSIAEVALAAENRSITICENYTLNFNSYSVSLDQNWENYLNQLYEIRTAQDYSSEDLKVTLISNKNGIIDSTVLLRKVLTTKLFLDNIEAIALETNSISSDFKELLQNF